MSLFNIPVSPGNLFQRIVPVDDRFYLSRLHHLSLNEIRYSTGIFGISSSTDRYFPFGDSLFTTEQEGRAHLPGIPWKEAPTLQSGPARVCFSRKICSPSHDNKTYH
jgi:hypothetical protein